MKFSIALLSTLIAAAVAAPIGDSNGSSVNSTDAPTATGGPLIVNGFAMPSASATSFSPAPDVTAVGSITILSTPTPSAGYKSIPSSKNYLAAVALGLLVPTTASFFL
jgi:hypothetical protein